MAKDNGPHPELMRIGELARIVQTPTETIRFYEREGLLHEPSRSDGNYRIYGPEHLERLAFIRHCRFLDMTLEEIRTLLHYRDAPDEQCGEVTHVIEEHIEHVTARIHQLKALEAELRRLRSTCAGGNDAAHCGILGGLKEGSSKLPDVSERALPIPGSHSRAGQSTSNPTAERKRKYRNPVGTPSEEPHHDH